MNYYTPNKLNAKATIEMDKSGEIFYVHCPYEIRSLASSAGGKWTQRKKAWMFAFTPSVVDMVEKRFKDNIVISPAFKMLLNRKIQQEKEVLKLREEASKNTPVDFSVEGISLDGKNPFFNYQKHGVICASQANDGFMIGDVVGCGKCEIVDNKIFTPEGKKRIGDIVVGDDVIGSDGLSHKVVGVFPQGIKPVYKVTFSDDYYIECGEEHLWTIFNDVERKTLTTKEIMNLDYQEWQIPVVKPIKFNKQSNLIFPLSFYEIGEIFSENIDFFTEEKNKSELYILETVKYLSIDDKISFLQGLMDNNGYCDEEITVLQINSEIFLDSMAEFIQTLGGIVRKCKKDENMWLYMLLPKDFNPFKNSEYKKIYDNARHFDACRFIKDISYVGEKECVCIAVDAEDHLYVTEHCIVTHNTIQALGTAINRKLKNEINSCLIVCPASLKYNWESEIKKFTNESVLVINGTKEEREKQWTAEGYFFKIANYECVMNDLFYEVEKKKKTQRPDNRIEAADFILNNYFSMVVCDEVHYLKSHDALRTKAMKKFNCKYRLGLTGTPIDGRLEELHSIFEFIKPGLFPSKSRFLEKYAILDYWGAIKGYKNIDEVKNKILPFYVRRLKEDVLNDLPEKIFIDLFVELEDKALKEYKKIASRKHEITEEKAAIEAIIRCRQFCDFPELLDLRYASAKFAMLYDLLKELVFDNKEKVIIFTQYKESLDLLKRNLEDEFDLSFIYGEIPSKERFDIVKDFKSNPKRQVLIMTDAGAEGLNLQEANNLIHYNDNYSPAKMIQRNGRVDRIGQKKVVRIYRFICKDTIEERVRELLEKKQTVNNSILDEDNKELSLNETSTMDILGCL